MKCIVCGGNSFHVVVSKLRYNIPRKVVKCDSCSQISLENPSEGAIDYSGHEYRESYSTVLGKKTLPKEEFDIKIQFQNKRTERMKSILIPEAKVLEIGCSTGHFLYAIKDKVSEVVGIELYPEHAKFARDYCKVEVHEKPLDKAPLKEKYFDVICMFQVFEHIPNPLDLLSLCRRYLKPSGTIVLEVPNTNDALLTVYDAPIFRERFYAAPHHYYYSADTLTRMLRKGSFVGFARTVQDYTIFNHMHWLLTSKPMADQTKGYNWPEWSCPDPTKKDIETILNKWLEKANVEYKSLLEKLGIAEHVWYEGKPVKDHS